MTAIQRFAIHGTIMNPHSSGPYVRHEDHLAAMQGRCLAQIEEPAGAAPAAVGGPAREEIAALREEHGITSTGRGIKEFEQVDAFVRAVLQRWGVAPALEAPAADMTAAVDAAKVEMRNIHPPMRRSECERLIRAALAAVPQAPAAPSDPMDWPLPCDVTVGHITIRKGCELRTLVLRMQVLYDLSRKVELAAPAAPAVDAALNALIADVRALPTLRASEIDGEESDGTPKHWRNRPFVSLRKLELLLRDRVTASSDTALLNFVAAEYLDLRSFGMPTGQGDADVGWRVVQHHMGEPTERVVAEVYKDDPRSAIRAAIARLERDPYCTGVLALQLELCTEILKDKSQDRRTQRPTGHKES